MTVKKLNPMPKNLMFALDIGTRSVVGILSKKDGKTHVIIDTEVMAHPERAMFDGQIHDIQKVTDVVRIVIDALETRNGFRLEQAAIAAAGRALKTERTVFEQAIDLTKEIDKTLTDGIEMQAIQQSQNILAQNQALKSNYYCVGYSVINYYLDQSMILNPVGHRGSKLSVDIIATFLPHIVVDSLYSVIHKAGLEVMNLTLEPIAAINVAIPTNLRLLNLALVDVGAGTSDIAISKDGSVVSYGMVSLAGDEITEKIAQAYLLDFNRAEALKVELNQKEHHAFTDVIGMTHELSTSVILEQIDPVIKHITTEIAEHIIALNKKPPSAVFCIGGGSQIPGFTEHLAHALSLPKERVVIKEIDNVEHIRFETTPLKGPEFITPIGIGATAFDERDQDFISVTVNDTTIRLFNSKPLQVSDALILTGYNARSLISERGESYFITIDGESREIKGEYGEPAQIYINGVLGHLDSKINHKDLITVIPAEKGALRKLTLSEAIKMNRIITLNQQEINIVEFISVNGANRTGEYLLRAGDVIETKGPKTVKDLAGVCEIDLSEYVITLNGSVLDDNHVLIPGSNYAFNKQERSTMTDKDIKATSQIGSSDEHLSASIEIIVNGDAIEIPYKDKKELVFVDLFSYYAFDLTKPQGVLVLKLNGERAKYTDILNHGDVIDIYWKN